MLAAQTDKILFEPRREDWHDTPLHQISKLSNVPPRFIFEGLMSFVQRPNPWKENYFELRILKSFTGHGKKTENLLFQGTDGEGGAQQELSTGARGKNDEDRSDGQDAAHDIRLVELSFHMLTSGQLTV